MDGHAIEPSSGAQSPYFLESALDEFGLLWIPFGLLLILASVAVLFVTILP
jgi:hypothetical protein